MIEEPTDKATVLDPSKCEIDIRVGKDGVWMTFTASTGVSANIHVWNVLGGQGGILRSAIGDWCLDRQKDAGR